MKITGADLLFVLFGFVVLVVFEHYWTTRR